MQCEQFQQWILLLETGELSDQRIRRTRQHLLQCPVCRDFHRTLQNLRDIGLEQVPPPSAFTMHKIRQHISAGTPNIQRQPARRLYGLLKTAALLVILLAGARIFLQWRRPAPTTAASPSVINSPVSEEFSTLAEMLITDRVVELQLFEDFPDPQLTPLEREIMILEGRAI